ncbi:MAG: hypothetical protein IKI95_00635 [Clostridia bacterium]|nr:hypothetical protein [Clostridia bacterium]
MAKETKTLNTVIVQSFKAIAEELGVNPRNITEQNLIDLGIIDARGASDTAKYDPLERRMLLEATRTLLSGGDAMPLFEHLQRKNPEYGDTVGEDTAFQTMYRTITGQNKTVLGYDHRIKALEERFHSHVTTGKMRKMLEKGEVAPIDYMKALSAAAYTERRYQETAPYREILRKSQDALVRFPFREPGGADVTLDADLSAVLGRIGVDTQALAKAINGSTAEDHFGHGTADVKYNMGYFDESLTNKGLDRVEKAAKDTYALMTEGFFRSGLGLPIQLPNGQTVSAFDVRDISPKDRGVLSEILAFKPGETLTATQTRVADYGRILSDSVNASFVLNSQKVEGAYSDLDLLAKTFGYDPEDERTLTEVSAILKNDIANGVISAGGTATTSRAAFLYSALQVATDPEFIKAHYGELPLQQPQIEFPIVKVNPETKEVVSREPGEVRMLPYQAFLFADNNVYPVTIPCRPEELDEEQIEEITSRINNPDPNNPKAGADTKANFRGVTAENFRIGPTCLTAALFDAFATAKEQEITKQEAPKGTPAYKAENLYGASKPALYRDLVQYKAYYAQAKESLKAYCLNGGPLFVREIVQEITPDPVPPVPVDPDPVDPDPVDPDPKDPVIDPEKEKQHILSLETQLSKIVECQRVLNDATANADEKAAADSELRCRDILHVTTKIVRLNVGSTERYIKELREKHLEAQTEGQPEVDTLEGTKADYLQLAIERNNTYLARKELNASENPDPAEIARLDIARNTQYAQARELIGKMTDLTPVQVAAPDPAAAQ